MRSPLSKRNSGFTLLEVVLFFVLAALFLSSLAGAHSYFSKSIKTKIRTLGVYHDIQNFLDQSERQFRRMQALYPDGTLEMGKEKMAFMGEKGEGFGITWEKNRLTLTIIAAEKSSPRVFSSEIRDTAVAVKKKNEQEGLFLKNIDSIDFQFTVEDDDVIHSLISL
jgi:hypothetical protein